jgi:hypothetical protein
LFICSGKGDDVHYARFVRLGNSKLVEEDLGTAAAKLKKTVIILAVRDADFSAIFALHGTAGR